MTEAATQLVAQDAGGISVVVRNRDAANPIYLGASGVTSAAGFQLDAGDAVSIDLGPGESLYGICGAGLTARADVLESNA